MRKKILFLDQFGTLGGGQRVLLDTLSVLDPTEFEATVALNGNGGLKRLLLTSGTPVIDLPLGNYRSGTKTIWDIARFGPRTVLCSGFLSSFIARNSYDLIFANGPRTFACATLAGCLTRRPVVWHLHNVFSSKAVAKGLSVLASYVSQIITCSKSAAETLLEYRPDLHSKIRLIPNSVPDWDSDKTWDTANLKQSFGIEQGSVSFGILGRVTPFKGQTQFIEAARLVRQYSKRVRFFIIGSPACDDPQDLTYYQGLRTQIEKSRMQSCMHFIEHQSEIQQYYSLIDVLVLASQGAEASPRTLLEAMYLGKPVIAPSHGGIPEIVTDGQTGLLVETAEPRLLAGKMLELVDNPENRSLLGAAARNDVMRRFSREGFRREMSKALTGCFESAAKSSEKQANPAIVSEG